MGRRDRVVGFEVVGLAVCGGRWNCRRRRRETRRNAFDPVAARTVRTLRRGSGGGGGPTRQTFILLEPVANSDWPTSWRTRFNRSTMRKI